MIPRDLLRFQLLQGMGKGKVADVVEKSSIGNQLLPLPNLLRLRVPLPEESKGCPGQMVNAYGMIEAGVGRTRVNEVGKAQLRVLS